MFDHETDFILLFFNLEEQMPTHYTGMVINIHINADSIIMLWQVLYTKLQ